MIPLVTDCTTSFRTPCIIWGFFASAVLWYEQWTTSYMKRDVMPVTFKNNNQFLRNPRLEF